MSARLAKTLGAALATVLMLIGSVYGVAWLNIDNSGLARSIVWMDAYTDDHLRFPSRTIAAGTAPFTYSQ